MGSDDGVADQVFSGRARDIVTYVGHLDRADTLHKCEIVEVVDAH